VVEPAALELAQAPDVVRRALQVNLAASQVERRRIDDATSTSSGNAVWYPE
jgi:hypothetical protein